MDGKIKSLLLLFVLGITVSISGCSSNGTSTNNDIGFLKGVVTDQETGDPLANAELSTGTFTVISSADGSYMFENIPTGSRSIFITHELYDPQTVDVDIIKDDTVSQDVALTFGGYGKITGTVQTDGSLPSTTFKLAVVGSADTFDVAENGQILTDYIPIGTLTVDIIPADYYFIQRITDVEVSRKSTTDIGNIALRDLFVDHVVDDTCFIDDNGCVGFDQYDYAYTDPQGCNDELIVDLGANEEAIPGSGPGLEFKIGGAGEVSGQIKVSDTDSTFNNFVNYYDLAHFSFNFDASGGSQTIQFGLGNSGMSKIRYISFSIDGAVDEGRLYYIKVLNKVNNPE